MDDINSKILATVTALKASDLRLKRIEESYQNLQRLMFNYFDRDCRSTDSLDSTSSGSYLSESLPSTPPDSPSESSMRRRLKKKTRRAKRRKMFRRETLEEVSDEEVVTEPPATETVIEQMNQKGTSLKKRLLSSGTSSSRDEEIKTKQDNGDEQGTEVSSELERDKIAIKPKTSKAHEQAVGHRQKTAEEEERSQKAREKRRRSSGGSRHSSESSCFARSSKERKLSSDHQKKSSLRRISRGSRKSSYNDDGKILSPSRVTFIEHDGRSTYERTEDSDTDHFVRNSTLQRSSGSNKVQRSVSQPTDQQNMQREGPLIYERTYSSSSSGRPRIRVIPPSSPPLPLIKINAEYTSLADELENVVMARLSPPSSPHVKFGRIRHHSEGAGMSPFVGYHNPLRDAEEADFLIMEGLIQRRLYRNSENLAVSLEELCSIHAENTEHDVLLIQSQSPPSTVTDPISIEKSPTLQEFCTQNDSEIPAVIKDPTPESPNRYRRLGHMGDIKKRHSISIVDSTKLGSSHFDNLRQAASALAPEENGSNKNLQSEEPFPNLRMASPEDSQVDSSPSQLRSRQLPQNLSLGPTSSSISASNSLLPPNRVIASPVHSVLFVDQSVVPLTLAPSAARDGKQPPSSANSLGNFSCQASNLQPPSQPLVSPVMQHVHLSFRQNNDILAMPTPVLRTSSRNNLSRQLSLDPSIQSCSTSRLPTSPAAAASSSQQFQDVILRTVSSTSVHSQQPTIPQGSSSQILHSDASSMSTTATVWHFHARPASSSRASSPSCSRAPVSIAKSLETIGTFVAPETQIGKQSSSASTIHERLNEAVADNVGVPSTLIPSQQPQTQLGKGLSRSCTIKIGDTSTLWTEPVLPERIPQNQSTSNVQGSKQASISCKDLTETQC